MATPTIPITGDASADRLLASDPLALLLGMLLDQQVPMEWAFKGPATLKERLGHLDATRIAAMGERIHAVCSHVTEQYDGDAARIWKGARSADRVYDRLRALPGYGDEKTRIFLAILGKRFGRRPAGWEEAAAPFSDDEPRSVADVADEDSLLAVREWKQMMKAKKKSKQD